MEKKFDHSFNLKNIILTLCLDVVDVSINLVFCPFFFYFQGGITALPVTRGQNKEQHLFCFRWTEFIDTDALSLLLPSPFLLLFWTLIVPFSFFLLHWFPNFLEWKGEAQRHINCLHFATEVALWGPGP